MKRNAGFASGWVGLGFLAGFGPVGCGSSHSDGNNEVCVPSTEVCDGIDNDCDGLTDEGFLAEQVSSQNRISVAEDADGDPSVAWAGDGFGVAWNRSWYDTQEQDEIYFARLDPTGKLVGAEVRITNANGLSRRPSLVWTGTEFGLVWSDTRDVNHVIYFARLDAAGNKLSDDIQVTDPAFDDISPALAWAEGSYAVTWRRFRDGFNASDIWFQRLSEAGEALGPATRVNAGGLDGGYHAFVSSLTWTGTEFGVAWDTSWSDYVGNGVAEVSIYFSRLDPNGNVLGTQPMVSQVYELTEAYDPTVVWTGAEYLVSWDVVDAFGGYPQGEILLARLDANGVAVGSPVRHTNDVVESGNAAMVSDGSSLGVAWEDARDWPDEAPEIYFAQLDLTGQPLTSDLRISVTDAATNSVWPSIAAGNGRFVMCWSDGRNGQYDIYCSSVGCQ